MKTAFWIALFLAVVSPLQAQNQNVRLVAHVNDYPQRGYSDVWGYTAPDGREYALLGVTDGVSIVDVGDTNAVSEVDFVRFFDAPPLGWYDIKTYRHYMYVSTEGGPAIQIVDLAFLPDSASVVNTYSGFTSNPHNIFIDTTMALLYVAEDFQFDPAVRVLSLADPENPVEIATIGSADIGTDSHDLFARDSILYVAEGTSPTIGIFDMRDPANPALLMRHGIPSPGYVHQVWVSEDNTLMVTTEETPEKTVKLWDITDLNAISLMGEYLGGSRLAHNAYLSDSLMVVAHYESGLKVMDISDPAAPLEVGFYDTYPQGEGPAFNGAWGVYPFTANGLIYVSDQWCPGVLKKWDT